MRIRKIVLLALLLILASISYLYAGGANEGNLYYFPRSIVDNRNLMIELAGQYELTANDINADFENTSPNQLAFFRIRDSLSSDGSSGGLNNNNVSMTITSLDNWEFVHETNTTSTRSFSLSAFCTEQVESSRSYNPQTPKALTLNTNVTLADTNVKVKFEKNGNTYSMNLPTTAFRRDKMSLYASYIRDFDFCIVLPAIQSGTYLEAGYYTTRLVVTFSSFVKSEAQSNWIGYVTHSHSRGDLTSITITLRGYVGITPEMSEEPFFIVTSTAYTYTMDLAPEGQNPRYHIANLSFTNSKLSNTNPNNASDTEKGGKYKIYVSPTRDYQAAGKYYFIKVGTENEARTTDKTIYYDLYTSASGNNSRITSGSSSTNSQSYAFTPSFTSPQISSSGVAGGQNVWKYTWDLNQNLYLQILDPATTRQPGLYYSYIYFTLVTY